MTIAGMVSDVQQCFHTNMNEHEYLMSGNESVASEL